MADASNPWARESWSITGQAAYVRLHGATRAEARARDAGTTLGGGPPAVKVAAPRPPDPTNPWSAAGWSVTAQMAYIRQHGLARAEARARDAGTTVTATRPPLAAAALVRPGSNAIYRVKDGSAYVPARRRAAAATHPTTALSAAAALGITQITSLSVQQQLIAAAALGFTETAALRTEVDITSETFVAVSANGVHRVMTSIDGTTWAAQTAAEANSWRSVCWAPSLGLFCAVASTGTHQVMTSPDGVTWTAQTAAEANPWFAVCWSPSLSLFCAVANSGTHQVMTSPDGITWTPRTAANASTWLNICWSPDLAIFCAVSNSGTGVKRVMTSPDGTNWTERTEAEANSWSDVCWSTDLGLFCAVAPDGTHRVMTSPNGTAWTSQTASEANTWNAVCWSRSLKLFVATSTGSPISNNFMTSPNGSAWTGRSAVTSTWKHIVWSIKDLIFAAVSNSGVANSSTDGVTFTARTAAEANQWQSVCCQDYAGRVAAALGISMVAAVTPEMRLSASSALAISMAASVTLSSSISLTQIITNETGFSGTMVTTTGVAVPTGSLILVAVRDDTSSVGTRTCVDSKSNTYTTVSQVAINNNTGLGAVTLFYAWNCIALTSTDTITVSSAHTSEIIQMTACYASGIQTSSDPQDTAVKATNTGVSTTPSVTSGTPVQAGELFVGVLGVGITEATDEGFNQDTGNGWAAPPNRRFNTDGTRGGSVEGGTLVNAGTGTKTYAPTTNVSQNWGIIITGFKHA